MQCMQYAKIDRHLEGIVKASAFLARTKGKDQHVISLLEQQYHKDAEALDNVAALCFYLWFLADDRLDLADTNSVFQVTFDVLNKLDDILETHPEHWLLWILKYKIQSFMNFNEDELICDLDLLSQKQRAGEQMPYYLVTEVLLAHICYQSDRFTYSRDILKGILETYSSKIDILGNFFKGYVAEFKNIVMRSGDDDILQLLETIEKTYF